MLTRAYCIPGKKNTENESSQTYRLSQADFKLTVVTEVTEEYGVWGPYVVRTHIKSRIPNPCCRRHQLAIPYRIVLQGFSFLVPHEEIICQRVGR